MIAAARAWRSQGRQYCVKALPWSRMRASTISQRYASSGRRGESIPRLVPQMAAVGTQVARRTSSGQSRGTARQRLDTPHGTQVLLGPAATHPGRLPQVVLGEDTQHGGADARPGALFSLYGDEGTGSVSCNSVFILHLGRFLDQEELMEREAMVQHP